jgi:acetyl-CoA acetyltransferase
LHFAAQAVMVGTMDVVIACGVEGMSRVPMFTASALLQENRLGYYLSPNLRQRYSDFDDFSQFAGAEMIAKKYGLSKDQIDEFAYYSHQLAITATREELFKNEILPVEVQMANGGLGDDARIEKARMNNDDIDLHEVNEAFGSVLLAWLQATGADPACLNVNGGEIALGQPLGASSTKLTTTLLYAFKNRNKRYGLQTMCDSVEWTTSPSLNGCNQRMP